MRVVYYVFDVLGLDGRATVDLPYTRLNGPYRSGRRSPDWVKHVLLRTQEVVIIGYTAGAGRRSGTIGALLLAVGDAASGALTYAGNMGTGLTDAMLRELHAALLPLRRAAAAVPDMPRGQTRGVQWVEPVIGW